MKTPIIHWIKMNRQFFYAMIIYVFGVILLWSFSNNTWDRLPEKKRLIAGMLSTAILYRFSRYSKLCLFCLLYIIVLYMLPIAVKWNLGMSLSFLEASGSLLCGIFFLCFLILLREISSGGGTKGVCLLKKTLNFIIYGIGILATLLPLLIGGYYFVNQQLLTPEILLTLFQTNEKEIFSYLRMQNLPLWGLGTGIIILLEILWLKTLIHYPIDERPIRQKRMIIFLLLAATVGLAGSVGKTYEANLLKMTWNGLQEYKAYGLAKIEREARLSALPGVTIQPAHNGIYMLVIGESETRDHMSLYGYSRQTTPWLEKFAKEQGTLVFQNAYSNHTHTVPVLTYALSEKNQYNEKALKDAYSIVEVAKAAGFKTYWISNQVKYGVWDTPIAEIASTADYQVWLNQNVGETTSTTYFDGQLVEVIPDLSDVENGLVIVHLMGNHGWYGDRYPKEYQNFSGENRVVDAYDNSILYNDFVLEQLYKSLTKYPNFNGWVYLSDHGDDADRNISHEATKFTFTMSHIPLIMHFSDSYISQNENIYRELTAHVKSYWTNDLLYNVLISILGIEGMPQEHTLDLSSSSYDRTQDNVMTLHGKKRINEDK